MYKVVRFFFEGGKLTMRTIKSGLTLEEAQAHCKAPEASSNTCTTAVGRRRTKERGPWFDSYMET